MLCTEATLARWRALTQPFDVAALAAIAQHYRMHLAPNHVVQPIGLLTLRPKNGIWVTLEARTPGAVVRPAFGWPVRPALPG